MSDISDILHNDIYPNIDISEALKDLNPLDHGGYYTLTCPECGKKEAFIYKGSGYIKCNRLNECGHGESLWGYVQRTRSLSPQETLQELARLANVSLPEREYDHEEVDKARRRTDILEKALSFFQRELFSDRGKETLLYLKDRGYSDIEIQNMELGHYPGYDTTSEYLKAKSFTAEDIDTALKWCNYNGSKNRDDYKVVIPYRKPFGQLIGFYGRLVRPLEDGEKENNKYMPFTEASGLRDTLFNLHANYGQKDLVIVEGYFDSLISTQRDIPGVVSLGQGSLREVQLQDIIKRGVGNITLALDQDTKSGPDNTEKAIKRIEDYNRDRKTADRINVYVASWDPKYKDPDELMSAAGPEAFQKAIDNPQRSYEWQMNRLLISKTANSPEEDTLYYDIVSHISSISDEKARTRSIGMVCCDPRFSDLNQGIIDDEIEKLRKERADERFKNNYELLLQEALQKSKEGKSVESILQLGNRLTDLKIKREKILIIPGIPFHEQLVAKLERDMNRAPDKCLGYKLDLFKTLSTNLDGIQPGFYILGAETSFGKSAFLCNLFWDFLKTNASAHGIYFSLDDNKNTIVNRLLSIITNVNINDTNKPKDKPQVQQAYKETLIPMALTGKLLIKDVSEIQHINALDLEIREHAGDELLVVIDGLYNIPMDSGYGSIRETNIDRANQIKALSDSYDIPVICSGELRKRGTNDLPDKRPTVNDLMESGKFAYNANLVWLLYPESRESFKGDPKPSLILNYEKNKLSHFMSEQKLKLYKTTGIIEETI